MAFDKGVDWEDTQTKNWNVAKPYTQDKIHKWLVLIDNYQTISIFGYSNLESDVFVNDKNLQNTSRLHALKRLIHAISSLIRNTRFAVRKEARPIFEGYSTRLKKIESNLFRLRLEKKRGNKLVELNIDETLFEKIMGEISQIIDEVNTRLNDADLIFTHTEEYDPKKIKEGYKEKYINRT